MANVYLYPVWIRLWHLLNAILFLMLIATGLSMQYSNPQYPLIRFDIAVSIHNICGIVLTATYVIILLGNLFTKNGSYYKIRWSIFKNEIPLQFHYYISGMFRHEKAPFPITAARKFNPLQKIAYVVVLYFLMPLIFISGWALIFPELIFVNRLFNMGGLHLTDLLHITVGFVLSLFMFIHIYLCTIGKPAGTHFRAMLSGWHYSE